MSAEHRLHAVRNQFSAGQGKLHAAVPHGNTVTDAGQIEFHGGAPRLAHFFLDQRGYLIQVNMAGNHFIEGIANGDERAAQILIRHPRGAHQTAVRRTLETCFNFIASHGNILWCGASVPHDGGKRS